MLGLIHRVASQLAAVAVAMALSGLPQLVEPPERVGHRCQCPVRNGKHECDCPLCHAEAARLGKSAATDPSVPACHKALAAKSRAEADRSARRRAEADPCLVSTCGTSDPRYRPPPSAERFTVPPPLRLAVREITAEVPVTRSLVLTALREPETPPPRRG